MRIMTFNLRCDFPLDFGNRWNSRKEMIYNIMKNYNCDIIGIQECTNKMFKDIQDNIDNYNIVGSPRSKRFFVEKNDILVLKKHFIKENRTFWLSDNPDRVGSMKWYSLFPRICTTAIVKIENNQTIRVFNSHLDCLLPQAREYGLRKIMQIITEDEKKEKLPTILMGDFNATPNSKLIKDFSQGKFSSKRLVAVQDINKELYNQGTMGNFKGKENGVHIDYIFVSEEIEIMNAEIIKYNVNGKYPSDHYPLIADIKIKSF